MLLLRISHVINHSELIEWIRNPEIVKVQAEYSENKGLRNPDLVRIHAFHRIDDADLNRVLGNCRKAVTGAKTDDTDRKWLNGVQSLKNDGFISTKMVLKLQEIQNKYTDLNLGLPNSVFETLEKYWFVSINRKI